MAGSCGDSSRNSVRVSENSVRGEERYSEREVSFISWLEIGPAPEAPEVSFSLKLSSPQTELSETSSVNQAACRVRS